VRVSLPPGSLLLCTDAGEEPGRAEEADGVDQDRERGRDRADEDACEARPGDERARSADLELRVAVHELVLPDERRKVGLVCHVEEDRPNPDAEGDDVELPDREGVDRVSDRDGYEQEPAPDVSGDEDGPAPKAVDPDARR
jgi:hypothetical protein